MYQKEEILQRANDRNFIMQAVRQEPWVYEFASDELHDDEELAFEAVSRDGVLLEFVSNRLRNNKKIVLEAVSKVRMGCLLCK